MLVGSGPEEDGRPPPDALPPAEHMISVFKDQDGRGWSFYAQGVARHNFPSAIAALAALEAHRMNWSTPAPHFGFRADASVDALDWSNPAAPSSHATQQQRDVQGAPTRAIAGSSSSSDTNAHAGQVQAGDGARQVTARHKRIAVNEDVLEEVTL